MWGFFLWSLRCYSVISVILVLQLSSFGIRAGCFPPTVFLVSCNSQCSVALPVFLAVPWVGLRSVIVVFPDHIHFLFIQNPSQN